MWTCLEVVLWGVIQISTVRMPDVQFSSIGTPNRNQQCGGTTQQKQPDLSQISRKRHLDHQERFSALLLSKISKNWRPRSIERLAIQVLYYCLLSTIYTLSKHHGSSYGSWLSKTTCESAHRVMTQWYNQKLLLQFLKFNFGNRTAFRMPN